MQLTSSSTFLGHSSLSAGLLSLTLVACGGQSADSSATGRAPAAAPGAAQAVNDAAPGWVGKGDQTTDDGYLFVCEGNGANEADALTTAHAICDDKICKLCGVEIESIVQTEETLTGVDLQRKVIERCRRVRHKEPQVARKSVECGPGGCFAWLQIAYANEDKEQECQRLSDEDFDDPKACQNTIEAFKNTEGHDAASFRKRVALMDDAISQCSGIDVRPTPLMGSMEEKLEVGMSNFNSSNSRAPSFLKQYWLAPHPPLWEEYRQSDTFGARLQLLRNYLAHKVLMLDVIEATSVDNLNEAEAIDRLYESMKAASPAPAYGTEAVHRVAIQGLVDWHRRGRPLPSVERICALVRELYPAGSLNAVFAFVGVLAIDGKIDETDWDYLWAMPSHSAAVRAALEVRDHGSPQIRFDRHAKALERALGNIDRPKRAYQQVTPSKDAMFLLDLEPRLPKKIAETIINWSYFQGVYRGNDDQLNPGERQRLLARLLKALQLVPSPTKARRSYCNGLGDDLTFLEERGVETQSVNEQICTCLAEVFADEPVTLGNKSDLYHRALYRELPCVQPK